MEKAELSIQEVIDINTSNAKINLSKSYDFFKKGNPSDGMRFLTSARLQMKYAILYQMRIIKNNHC